jgi:mannose-6-phosphate isomerase-like protein (cupin superfamily)
MKATAAEFFAKIPGPITAHWPEGERFAVALQHGSMKVELYAPRGTDPQAPHRQDELYVVISGDGEFLCGETRTSFSQGDVLFVPAGVTHRFENFSDDFVTWVIFYGPDGGEKR